MDYDGCGGVMRRFGCFYLFIFFKKGVFSFCNEFDIVYRILIIFGYFLSYLLKV